MAKKNIPVRKSPAHVIELRKELLGTRNMQAGLNIARLHFNAAVKRFKQDQDKPGFELTRREIVRYFGRVNQRCGMPGGKTAGRDMAWRILKTEVVGFANAPGYAARKIRAAAIHQAA